MMRRARLHTHATAFLCWAALSTLASLHASGAEVPEWIARPVAPNAAQAQGPKLVLWLKAEDLKDLTDGAPVARWDDGSGNGHHPTAEGEARPVYRSRLAEAGNRPAVVFGGGRPPWRNPPQALSLRMNDEWRGATVFAVGTGLGGIGWLNTADGRQGCLRTMNGAVQIARMAQSVPAAFKGLTWDRIALACVSASYDSSMAMHLATYVDGQPTGEATDPDCLFGIVCQQMVIGAVGKTAAFSGALCEMLIYKGELSAAQRNQVEAYLMAKYGLPGAPAAATAPRVPWGFPTEMPARPPAFAGKPPAAGLVLWARSEDLPDAPDGAVVTAWPNRAGDGHPLTAPETQAPALALGAVGGRPALRFQSSSQTGRLQVLDLPLGAGTWSEMTILVAGRGLAAGTLVDTGQNARGSLESSSGAGTAVTGTELRAVGIYPLRSAFPLAATAEPAALGIVVGPAAQNGRFLATYVGGKPQMLAEDPKAAGVTIRAPRIGVVRKDTSEFSGELAEVLVYNRALFDTELTQAFAYLNEKYAIPAPTPEQIERAARARSVWSVNLPRIEAAITWLGNSFGGLGGAFQSGVSDVAVRPDGTVLVSCSWDERGKTLGLYKDGAIVQPEYIGGGATDAIAVDDTYVYRAYRTWRAPMDVQLRRLALSNMEEAPWQDLNKQQWPSWTYPQHDPDRAIRGLAVDQHRVYAAFYGGHEVVVLDKHTGSQVLTFEIDNPSPRLAVAPDGRIWVGGAKGVVEYSAQGKPTGRRIDGVSGGGLAMDAAGRLMVAENGKRQQVIVYELGGPQPREVSTLGKPGGAYGGEVPGTITPDRLIQPVALGMDAAGNLYVVGGRTLRAYSPAGNMLWQLFCTEFCTTGDVDPASDGADIYTPTQHFRHEPGQTGGSDWKWVATTHDPEGYGTWAKPASGNIVRRIQGRLYNFWAEGTHVMVRRRPEGRELMVPCSLVYHQYRGIKGDAPEALPADAPQFVWTDRNGNGQPDAGEVVLPPEGTLRTQQHQNGSYVDEAGSIWFPESREGVRCLPILEFLTDGTPVYDYGRQKLYKRPPELIEVERVVYDARRDVMYMIGNGWQAPAASGAQIQVRGAGQEILCYDRWSTPERKLRWHTVVSHWATFLAFDVAFDTELLFAGDVTTASLLTFDTRTGKLLGVLEIDRKLLGETGWIDRRNAVRAFSRSNGETIVISENCVCENNIVYTIPRRK